MAKILIVDDDRSLLHIAKTVLVDEGYEVTTADSASQAMKALEETKPDLIVMDIVLPDISGAEAVKLLQKKRHLKNIPVVFLTGLISSTGGDTANTSIKINEKVYPTLGKPLNIEQLLESIENNIKS